MATPNFDEKLEELHSIQKTASAVHAKLNSLKSDYIDWFHRKQSTFAESLIFVQMSASQLIQSDVTTIRKFRDVLKTGELVMNAGHIRRRRRQNQILPELTPVLDYWTRFCEVKTDYDAMFQLVSDYCNSITKLRDDRVWEKLDLTDKRLNMAFSEDYDFMCVNNARQNLFTYRASGPATQCLGLLGYIPHLLELGISVCHGVSKLRLEEP